MTNKVEQLSERDQALIPGVVKKWIDIGTKTGRADRPLVEKTILELYKCQNLTAPKEIIWADSPYGTKEIFKKYGTTLSAELSNAAYGQHDVYWISLWDFFNQSESVQLEDMPAVAHLAVLAQQIGWWWPYDEVCIVTERPCEIHLDAGGRLHSDDGMAIKYNDGWGLYVHHGYRIPLSHHWMYTEREKLNPSMIEKEENAELRRIMLELYGFENYLNERKAKLVSEDVDGAGNPRRLYEIKVKGEKIPIIELHNSSLEPDGTRRKFFLGAMPGKNPHEAVSASFGFTPTAFKEAACS